MANLRNLSVASLGTILIVGTASAVQAAQFYGDSQQLGDGSVRSYVTLDDVSGEPLDIGVVFTQGVLSLPTSAGTSDSTVVLSLPSEASVTGFKQVELNYRPNGYPPGASDAIDVPQFEFYFFRLNSEERDGICPNAAPFQDDGSGRLVCAGEELAEAQEKPPGTFAETLVETGLGSALSTRPRYGSLYVDYEFARPAVEDPQSLTSFYGYTFYSGQETATEVVVGKAYFETQPNDATTSFKVPTASAKTGYYPFEYDIDYDAASQEYSVSLSELTFRRAVPEPSSILGLLFLGAWGAVFQVKNKLKNRN